MKKTFSLILAITIFFGAFSVAPVKVEAQGAAVIGAVACLSYNNIGTCLAYGLKLFFAWGIGIVLQFVSLLTNISGYLLNGVFYHTIVKMSDNYRNLAPLKATWGVIRDIANMSFIFVLLYAGIKTILGQEKNSQEVIKNVIIAAVLMNFSLFLTGVVIDISNALSVTLYDAIVPGVAAKGFQLQSGLSSAFMEHLKVQSLYKVATEIDVPGIIMVGIMGSIMLLITSFVFFAVAIMFVIRYVVLLLVLILSPIYFVSLALPKGVEMDGYKNQWLNSLLGQAFFAPIYLLITWIAVQVMGEMFKVLSKASGLSSTPTPAAALGSISDPKTPLSDGAALMFINFTIVIVLIITSLVMAKKWADKAGGGIGNLTKWATGVAGGATMGMAARLGRQTVGRGGQALADNDDLRNAANQRGFKGMSARLALATSKKAGAGSFDFRASRAGGVTLGQVGDVGKAKTGGFRQHREDIIKKRMQDLDQHNKTVTGADVEAAMAREPGNWSKANNDAQGRTAAEVEAKRRAVQNRLNEEAGRENARRKDEFLHRLSQTKWYSRGAYNGVYTDADAARRMRGKKKKGDELVDDDETEKKKEETKAEKEKKKMADAFEEAMRRNAEARKREAEERRQQRAQNQQNNSTGNNNSGNQQGNSGPGPQNPSGGGSSGGGSGQTPPPGGYGRSQNNQQAPPPGPGPGPDRTPPPNDDVRTRQQEEARRRADEESARQEQQQREEQERRERVRRRAEEEDRRRRQNQDQARQEEERGRSDEERRRQQQRQNRQTPPPNSGGRQSNPPPPPPPPPPPRNNGRRSFYSVLGVRENATQQEIKNAWRRMSRDRNNHPDAFTDPAEKAAAQERAKDINEAYQNLTGR